MQQLICPKCRANMTQYERNGVTVDQCMECRGIFLDRGELERLVDAEKAWNAANTPPAPPVPQPPQSQPPQYGQPQYGQPQYGHQQPQYGHQQHGYQKHHKKKHNSFFEELFD